MDIKTCIKESFCVIGKEGSTIDGDGFIQKLWADANNHFSEIEAIVKKDENGNPVGFWGAMSDFSRSFQPWHNFSEGLYLAGAEVINSAEAPEGWIKWVIPSYEYLYAKAGDNTFTEMTTYLQESNLRLAGAVNDFICPSENGQLYVFFPIRRL